MTQANNGSPILLIGDPYVSKNTLNKLRSNSANARWITLSASKESLDHIRLEVGCASFDDREKIVVIEEIPNRGQVRDFLLDLSANCPENTKIVLYDSDEVVKIDPKTNLADQSWQAFLSSFKKIDGSKVINNGNSLSEKDSVDCITFIKKAFSNHKIFIETSEAILLANIVGHDKGLLDSEINKLALTSPPSITSDFIVENAFPSSKESLVYKLSNVLDSLSYSASVELVDRMYESGIHYNVLADLLIKKARWQLVLIYFMSRGASWDEAKNKMMDMGKFPSFVWHKNITAPEKKLIETKFQDQKELREYLMHKRGLNYSHFKKSVYKKEASIKKRKSKKPIAEVSEPVKSKAERITHPYILECLVNFLKNKVIASNPGIKDIREALLSRAMAIYAELHERIVQMRYNDDPRGDIHYMCRIMCDVDLKQYE